MDMNRLLDLLDKWKLFMKYDNHKLGYPSKSIGMSSGGASGSFDEMYEEVEDSNIQTVDAVIHSLDPEEQKAIYARYLGTKKPMYYEIKLQIAIDKLLQIVSRRIGA